MTNVELLNRFFEAENKQDWPAFRGFLDPQVMCFVHSEDTHVPLAGREEFVNRAMDVAMNEKVTYACEGIEVSESGNRVIAFLRYSDNARILKIYDYENTLIKWVYEYTLS